MRFAPMSCVICVLVASCGGGGGDGGGGGGPGSTSVSGTAAQGAPLAGANVEMKCRTGSGAGTTDAAGRFSIALTGAQGPCLLKAAGSGLEMISVLAGNSGNANVTPLTHLLAARLFGSAPGSAFGSAAEAHFVLVTDQGISAAQGQVAEQIRRLGAEMPPVNWVTQTFAATPGDAMDGALELLKRRLDEQNKTLDAAAAEVAIGDLQNLEPPTGQSPTCVPGIIAGFTGPVQDTLGRVVSEDLSGGGDSPGGVGAGDGSGDGAAGGVGVGGSLGQLVNVDVTAEFASGTTFGPIRVNADTANGMVTLVPCDLAAPVLITVTGAAGAQYFDERLAAPASFEGHTLRAVLTRLDRNGGVTPFTDAIVRRAVALGEQVAADGGQRLKALTKAVDGWTDPARVQIAHEEVRKAVNDQLPAIYRLEDLNRLPVIVNQANSAPNSGVLTDNQNGVYGAVLAGFAKAAGALQPNADNPALAARNQFVEDLSDGVLNLRAGSTPVLTGPGGATYNYDTLFSRLTTETGGTAAALGTGGLKTRNAPVQRLRGKGGDNPDAAPGWVFSLASNGTLEIKPPAGHTGAFPVLPQGARFARIDVFDRSILTPGQSGDEPPWQNCLVALSADGRSLLTWQVGVSASSFVDFENFGDASAVPAKRRTVGSTGDPVVTIAPESLSLTSGSGGDSVVMVLRSGTLQEVGGCDQHDQHPQLATGFGSRYVVQVQQDYGNRYVVYSDGTVEGWGQQKSALGVNDPAGGVLQPDARKAVVAQSGNGALAGVSMLARGEQIHQTRALVRSAVAADDGKVFVWGRGLPVPRRIEGLDDICWIAGPYAVGCDGQLYRATVSAVTSGEPQISVSQVTGVTPIWRVNADYPVQRVLGGEPGSEDELTDLKLSYSAIAQDGQVYRLADGVAAVE